MIMISGPDLIRDCYKTLNDNIDEAEAGAPDIPHMPRITPHDLVDDTFRRLQEWFKEAGEAAGLLGEMRLEVVLCVWGGCGISYSVVNGDEVRRNINHNFALLEERASCLAEIRG